MKNTNTQLFGNVYLDPQAAASVDNQNSILEGFGENYQRLFDAIGSGEIIIPANSTNEQVSELCESWLARSK